MQKIEVIASAYRSKLKKKPTLAEIEFIKILKTYKIPFGFQKIIYTPTNFFIIDFLIIMKPRRIIEIDGNYHLNNKDYDKERELKILKTRYKKYKFLRITNDEVFNGKALEILQQTYKKKFKNK